MLYNMLIPIFQLCNIHQFPLKPVHAASEVNSSKIPGTASPLSANANHDDASDGLAHLLKFPKYQP